MESTTTKEILEEDENKLMQDIHNILADHNFFAHHHIEPHKLNPSVTQIGETGKNRSIPEWIRIIWALCVHHENTNPWAILQGFKCFNPIIGKPDHNNWFYGFRITRDGQEKTIFCGGIPDYTPDGKKTNALAEKFMEIVCSGSISVPISIISADKLGWALTGGMF